MSSECKSEGTLRPKSPTIPSTIIRSEIVHAWRSGSGAANVRIERRAFEAIRSEALVKIIKLLRAAQRISELGGRRVVSAAAIHLARTLMFKSIPKLPKLPNMRLISDNACRNIARACCSVSLSRRLCADPLRPYNAFGEIRRFLHEFISHFVLKLLESGPSMLRYAESNDVLTAMK
jgi:hypothetical protein